MISPVTQRGIAPLEGRGKPCFERPRRSPVAPQIGALQIAVGMALLCPEACEG